MSNNIRIKTTPNGTDKYLKVKLEQDFDFIEILSLKISQEDAYRRFCSDYGAVVGRVVVNGGFGIPNAKVSVFIPIDEVDKDNPLISGLYPYELVTDKDDEGIRYNLLPKESETNNPCFTPIGTFPNKREILDNDVMMDVYCKYYKFTTTTNFAGDFMIFGVPVGTHTIHVDVDMSDIGPFSQRPYDLISQGAPKKLFDSSTKFSANKNLDKLPQVKTANVGVNVQPFWGDLESCQVGISRIDVDLNYNLVPTAIFTGSIFGDQDKDSINKNCAPRQGMGEFCQQVTGNGTIEILRKTFEGETENFYVEGGQVIDENGVWAFQIPMNLDYVKTSEDGQLIPSNDPNIGVPTRTRARFRIGMDETGDNGRLRTRAKYLVPNNPQTDSQIDYSFDENTKDTSFRDMFWNKIYTVSNFISRYQKVKINTPGLVSTVAETTSPIGGFLPSRGRTRNFIGIKNVDDCAGVNTPFPYNRVNTRTNPLFFVICLLLKYIIFIIALLNSILIPLINRVIQAINFVISIINTIIDAVNTLPFVNIGHVPEIGYIPCIKIECPNGSGVYFAPGCSTQNVLDGGLSFDATSPAPNFYCDGSCALFDSVGLDDCIAFQLASELNMYEFDFYNDWINGTLYSFLLKYKAKKNGKEKYCDYDCEDFDSSSDVDCNNQLLVDVMLPEFGNANSQDVVVNTGVVREGVVKKVDENLYYAATQHNAQAKLFATEVICLGSVFDCDWQGLPKIAQYFRPSSYQIPPVVPEFNDDGTIIEETGIVSLNDQADGLFFKINCSGLHVNAQQALNIRHACEIFVDLDVTSDTGIAPDGVIGSNDITDIGTDVRDIFVKLNSGTTGPNINFNNVSSYDATPINTAFNLPNIGEYDFTSPVQNGQEYIDFRGYYTYNTDTYTQPKFHSFFTYFGLIPNQSAMDILKRNYLGVCTPVVKARFVISTTVTPDVLNLNEGIIEFTILGSVGPYTYTVTNGSGYESTGTIGVTPPTVTITGLAVGTYTITVLDALGNPVTTTVSITGQQPLFCDVYVSQTDTSASGDNGQITIASVGGGVGPYNFEITDSLGNPVGSPSSGTITSLPLVINNLGPEPTGYIVTITDTTGNGCVTENLTMSGVYPLSLVVNQVQPTCYESTNGEIESVVTGGVAPYTIHVTGPSTDEYSSSVIGLGIGTYNITVVDFLGNTTSTTSSLTSVHPYLHIEPANATELAMQCSSTHYYIKFYVTSGIAPGSNAYVTYQLDNGVTYNTTLPFVDNATPLVLQVADALLNSNVKISVSDSANHECYSNQIQIYENQISLPNQALTATITTTPSGNMFNPYHHVININGGFAPYVISPINDDDYIDNSPTSTRTITDSVGCSITVTG
jgi:hypothetical protein